MKNQDISKLHFLLNIITRSIETYMEGYSAAIDPYEFMKASYNTLDLRYLHAMPNHYDFLDSVADLRMQKRLNRRNIYAALGKTIFQLNYKDLSFFTELMIRRGNLYKVTEPIEDEFLFVSEPALFMNESNKESYLISGSVNQLSDDELDFTSSLYPDLTDKLFEIDRKFCSVFQSPKLSDIQIDKDDQSIIEEIESALIKKKD
ncbi:MAG: hypothetical protein K2P81_00565 [Bacteriovoracaceae bacterium]|nr:hypothetical protein [Bacteriovoracaceae bacterium]